METVISDLVGMLAGEVERISDRVAVLERRAAQHDHAHEACLDGKPDDFGGVTSTGEAKPMKRWALVTSGGAEIFTPWDGFRLRDACFPATFETREFAALVRSSLFSPGSSVDLEEVEVVQREDGMLVEARYA